MTLITVSATAPDAIVAMPGAPRVKRPRAGTGDDCPAGKSRAEPTPGRADGVVRGWRQPVVERQSVRQPQPGTALSGEGADGPGLPQYRWRKTVKTQGNVARRDRTQGAGQGPGPRPVGAVADRRQYPMQRRTVGWWRDRTPENRPGASPRAVGAFANCGQYPMQRRTVGLVAGPNAGQPAGEVAPGGRGNPRISVQTYCNVARWSCHQNRE
jgi:hypothetical protein